MNCAFIIILLIPLAYNQQYPSCPGGSPLTLGNKTDPYNLHLIQLSTFLSFSNDELQQAFEQYLLTGSDEQVNNIIGKNKTFFVAITVLLIFVSLVLFVLLIKIGNIKFTDKDRFQKLKENGYSSPLSAFFTLIAVALLLFTSFSAYLLPSMINNAKMTQCRLDGLKNAFLKGVPQYGWDGIYKYIEKANIIQNLTISLERQVRLNNLTDLSNITAYADVFFKQARTLYNGVKDKYSSAQIIANQTNSTQNIALTTLIPNLFDKKQSVAILGQFEDYLANVQSSMDAYNKLEDILNDTYPQLNTTATLLNSSAYLLSIHAKDFLNRFLVFRTKIGPYFESVEYTLILCQVVTGICVACCLVSIITVRLIQADFDFFSLRMYKIIWACHILIFCLNLSLLLIFNQMIIYGEGACSTAEKVLKNQTLLHQLLPSTSNYSGMYILNSCSNKLNDFGSLSKTARHFTTFGSFVELKENIVWNYNRRNITPYSQVLENVRLNLTPYRVSVKGSYSYLNQQLTKINNILLKNPYSEYCFKHHWEYYPTSCSSTETVIVLPTNKFTTTLNQTNYKAAACACYILSNFDAYDPHFINHTQFLTLYSRYMGRCNTSISSLADPINQFFAAQTAKENVINNLLSDLNSIQSSLYNATFYLVSYLNQRLPLLDAIFSNLTNTNSYFISNGNGCSIMGALISGIYNEFCVNFRAQGRQVYLIVFCNLAYSIFLILLSFLYSLELQALKEKEKEELEQKTSMQNGVMISDENGSLAELQSHSSSHSNKNNK